MRDKVVVITGASRGIGAALAELLSARGARVVLVGRDEAALAAVAARCGAEALAVAADLSRREASVAVMERALARFGRVDVWVNNAGRGITRAVSELTDDDLDAMVTANVKTALYGMQAALPHFKARGDGHLVNVSSMLGRVPFFAPRSAYAGSKHLLNALTACLRSELQATHPAIHVSLVSPGVVRTEFGANALHGGPDSRTLPDSQSAEEVAAVLADVIERPRPDVYTRPGSQAAVAGYYQRVGVDP